MLWRAAMHRALYGPAGFFVTGDGPAAHFRTSAHASPLFAQALATLLIRLDQALDHPPRVDLVDLGAGRGELLHALADAVPATLAGRLRYTAVERAPRPAELPDWIDWRTELPRRITGLLLATEWLDNVPVDLAELDDTATPRYLRTDGRLGRVVSTPDARWLSRWWPPRPGGRAEIGRPRDTAWARAVSRLDRGLALAVDYGHLIDNRPILGTLTGYRYGRQVPPVPDGSCDLTAHVAFDALRTPTSELLTQREALHRLGCHGRRPPLALADTDPANYLAALAHATQAAELTDPAGLGGHYWLLEPVGIDRTDGAVPWRA